MSQSCLEAVGKLPFINFVQIDILQCVLFVGYKFGFTVGCPTLHILHPMFVAKNMSLYIP